MVNKYKQYLKDNNLITDETSNLLSHSIYELNLWLYGDNQEPDEYGLMVANGVIELLNVFAKQGHSGYSASITNSLFNKLVNYKPLTKLTYEDDEFFGDDTHFSGMNKRNSELFRDKSEDGTYLYKYCGVTLRHDGVTCTGPFIMPDGTKHKAYMKIEKNKQPKKFIIDCVKSGNDEDFDLIAIDQKQLQELKDYYPLEFAECCGNNCGCH
jgi:hypothetical protein